MERGEVWAAMEAETLSLMEEKVEVVKERRVEREEWREEVALEGARARVYRDATPRVRESPRQAATVCRAFSRPMHLVAHALDRLRWRPRLRGRRRRRWWRR